MKKILLLIITILGCVTLARSQDPTYINTSININNGVPTTWYGDVTFGPQAVVYIEDGATAIFYGKNMIVDPLTKFICLPSNNQTGTGVIIFRDNNPLYSSYPLQQTLNGGYTTGIDPSLPNIEIDNQLGVSLVGNTRVTNTIKFTKGHIYLNDFNLVLDNDAIFSNYDVTKHIVTNGIGVIVKEEVLTNASFLFPISIAGLDYTPATIINSSSKRNINVQVKNYVTSIANETTFASKGMDRTWQISSNIAGTADISLQHNSVTNSNGTGTNESLFNNAMAFVSQQISSGVWSQSKTFTDGGSPISIHLGNGLIIPSAKDATAYFTKQTNAGVDLSISKTLPNNSIALGSEFDYTIMVKNIGSSLATDVVSTDVLPAGLIFVSTNTTYGSVLYNTSNNTVVWTLGSLAVNGNAILTIKVKAIGAGVISNTATVTSKEIDINPVDNSSTVSLELLGLQIPNVITPDGDGKNDSFKIVGLEAYPESNIVIVNRWGNEVYHSTGLTYKNEWTGQGLNEGTYYYLLKIKDKSAKWHTYTGNILLIRP